MGKIFAFVDTTSTEKYGKKQLVKHHCVSESHRIPMINMQLLLKRMTEHLTMKHTFVCCF